MNRERFLTSFFAITFSIALSVSAHAANLYVGPNDPYKTIQAGIDAASKGDTVWVRPGTYSGTGNFDIDFKGKAVLLRSVGGPSKCIIDVQNRGRGFYFHSGETTASAVVGFTIKNGLAASDGGSGILCSSSPTIQNCVITNCTTGAESLQHYLPGAGIACIGGKPRITGCTISANSTGGPGGGIYIYNSSPTVTSCTIANNSASSGGGIFCEKTTANITSCTISGNGTGSYYGGGVYIGFSTAGLKMTSCTISGNKSQFGAGLLIMSGKPNGCTLTSCLIKGNTADYEGGGVAFIPFYDDPAYSAAATISNCTISENNSLGGEGGGGIYLPSKVNVNIRNCAIDKNTSTTNGSAIAVVGGAPNVVNCTFQANKATAASGGTIFNQSESPFLNIVNSTFADTSDHWISGNSSAYAKNCIFWGTSQGFKVVRVYTHISYSDIFGGYPGTGNINADPLFLDPVNGDFRLSAGSPCINTGSNTGLRLVLTTDKNLKPRPANSSFDMGAFEYQGN